MIKRRIARLSAAAVLLIGIGVVLASPPWLRPVPKVYADDMKAAGKATEGTETATWRTSYYMRFLSPDHKASKWVRVGNNDQRYFFKAPGLYRRETLDEAGRVKFVSIEDITNRTSLDLDPTEKTATLRYLSESSYSPLGPFATFTEAMKQDDLRGLGKKTVEGKEAAGYRYKFFAEGANQDWSYEFRLDPKSKRLVEGQVPGGDIFDLADVVRDKIWDPTMQSLVVDGTTYALANDLGIGNSASLVHKIVLGDPVDDSLFHAQPPAGYAVKDAPLEPVSEQDVTGFLGVVARYFGGTFPDSVLAFNHGPEYRRFETIERDVLAKKGGTPAEVAMVEAMHRWWRAGLPGPGPLHVFVTQHVEEGSWKYLGHGVKLGDKDRIVCWYRPAGSRTYRVVYGDLSVKDASQADLPLPPSH